MRYRALSPTGDFTLGTGADFLINTPAAVAQAVLTRLNLYTGDFFLDTSDGTPWRTAVLGKYTQSSFDAVIKQRILGTQDYQGNNLVLSILNYSSSVNASTRALTVSALLNTIYGQANVQTTLNQAASGAYLDVNFILDSSELV